MPLVFENLSGVAGQLVALMTPTGSLQTRVIGQFEQAPNTQFQIGWLPAGGSSNLFTLLPAGHSPGTYNVAASLSKRTGATAGNWTRNLTIPAPSFPALVIVDTGTLTGTTYQVVGIRQFVTDGTAAITAQWTAAGVTGAPVVDLYTSIALLNLL